MNTTGQISQIQLVMIPATDHDRSIAFYQSLGFQKRADFPWADGYRFRGCVERIIPDPEGAEFVRLAERYGKPQGPSPDAADRIAVAIRPEHTTTQ